MNNEFLPARKKSAATDVSTDKEPSFAPPDKIAADEEVIDMSDAVDSSKLAVENKKGSGSKQPSKISTWLASVRSWWAGRSTRQRVIMLIAMLAVVLALIGVGYKLFFDKPATKPAPVAKTETKKAEPPKPTTEASHLTGPDGLAKLRNDGARDLDQFYNGSAYQRITQRYAPHNVYTSLGSLVALEKSKGYTSSTFAGFPRKNEKAVTPATAKTIDFAISSALYYAHYDYDAASNSYLRSEGGAPHKDERSGQQINPKVVIGLVLPQGIDPDGLHTTYGTVGSGKAYIFQDGGVTVGTWSKASDKQQLTFGDANGAPLALDPGQTWITVLGSETLIKYTP
jgi:hypothetical protein